ncbi:RNA exonuclease 3 [Apiospora saccharicola]|uniref:RNA exonuclease 3 n=1 Tax=Apiospora saccharicola TaxID=335842 RepID=A0ABR1TNR5_9PEZI
MFTKPCTATKDHDPRHYRRDELETNWRFHRTPPATPQSPARIAIVFDCEMGVNVEGESDLIRLSVVDYFTSAVLLDSLVWPDAKMQTLNTPFSGVSWKALNDARRNKTCLFGRENARKAVWSLISPETVVIGHGANNDLNILRWIHPNVVDTLLVEQRLREKENAAMAREAEELGLEYEETKPSGGGGGMSLKNLTKDRLGRAIQAKGRGHDSIEDSIATRDILHWHVSRILQSGEP